MHLLITLSCALEIVIKSLPLLLLNYFQDSFIKIEFPVGPLVWHEPI